MIDKEGRTIDYVRISLTDRCNLRCVYCMPAEGVQQLPHEQILSYDEIIRVCKCLAGMGIKKIKLTGGEPLVRKDCASLVAELKSIPGIEKVTITTNGILLKDQMQELAAAGIDAINVSLDTLDPELFSRVTRRDRLHDVLSGIEEALKYPNIPVKINSVPISENPEDYISLARLAQKYQMHVRFIEMMPIGFGKDFPFHNEESIKEVLEREFGTMTECHTHYGNGPCHYYTITGFKGKIGFISAITHKFCNQCNRVRLTAEGYLKACLQYQTGADLRTVLRDGSDDEKLKETIRQVILNKPVCHNFNETHTVQDEVRSMSQIGG